MRLITLGKVRLADGGFSRPKPLLMLAYLTLEGPQSRSRLAELLWDDPKAKGNLSVVLSQFKKEGAAGVVPDQPGLDPLPSLAACDALEFQAAVLANNLAGALALYGGAFLEDLGKPLDDLEVSAELMDWVLVRREVFAQQAQSVMLALADEALSADDLETARGLAERAHDLPGAPELEPVAASRLQRLLSGTGSRLSKGLEKSLETSLDDLPAPTRTVFLALSQQQSPNLSAIRNAFEMTLAQVSEAREALFLAGLVDSDARVLAPEYAARWLETHPGERAPLLLALARATPIREAFALYQRVYADMQGFGGLGDAPRARAACCVRARALMDRLEFAEVNALMDQVQRVEQSMGLEPEPESVFLHAYALERLGRFRDALKVVASLPVGHHDPNVSALRAVLLSRTGKNAQARALAETILKSGVDWSWAKATAYNALGYVSSMDGDFAEAASMFKKSAALFEVAGDPHRRIGALSNQATELGKMAEQARNLGQSKAVVESFLTGSEAAYHEALDSLARLEVGNRPLEGRILFNLGRIFEARRNWVQAQGFYERAESVLEGAQLLELVARLKLNLGIIYKETGQVFKAQASLQEAIQTASLTGEPLIQALAMGHLALLGNDLDQIEIALDLFEQAGSLDQARTVLVDYRNILKTHLLEARQARDSGRVRRVLERLKSLHERLGNRELAGRVRNAIRSLEDATSAPLEANLNDLFRDLDLKQATRAI